MASKSARLAPVASISSTLGVLQVATVKLHPSDVPRLMSRALLFDGPSYDRFRDLCRRADYRVVPARTIIHTPARASDAMYMLAVGRVCVYLLTPSGRKVILDSL